MAGTHGDLFTDIGKMVLAAHAGQAIDLTAKSEELARRYWNLGVPAETIAKAIARSLGAIGISMALVPNADRKAGIGNGQIHMNGNGSGAIRVDGGIAGADETPADAEADSPSKAASGLFPSGVRLAVLS